MISATVFHRARRSASALLLAAPLVCLAAARAQTPLPAFSPPSGFGIKAISSSGLPLYGYTSSTTNNWTIAQWNKPAPLPPFAAVASVMSANGSFATHDSEASVTVTVGSAPTTALWQSGVNLPCTDASGKSLEYDLFAAPNKNIITAQEQSAFIGSRNPSAASSLVLANMAGLIEQGSFQAGKATLLNVPLACPNAQAQGSVSLVLQNTFVQPQQTLFYGLALYRYCPLLKASKCAAPTSSFYDTPSSSDGGQTKNVVYGYHDTLLSYGMPLVGQAQSATFDLDTLPRLKAVIAAGAPLGLDTNLSHWSLSGAYSGQQVWGNVALATAWSGFVPALVPLSN